MSSPNEHSDVKLERGQLVDRIKNLSQKEWMRACERLGLCVRPEAGKGGHCAVYKDEVWPPESPASCITTLPNSLYPNIQRNLVKKVVGYGRSSGKYTEDDVWTALKIKF